MNRIAISLAVPILLLLTWTLKLELQTQTGTEVRLKITGYDPRDLLSGHYIRYRIDIDANTCRNRHSESVCLCLHADEQSVYHSVKSVFRCQDNHARCEAILKGECSSGRFQAGIERYSIPEDLAPALAILPENSSVVLSIDSQGNALVKKVLVENETLESFANRNLNRPQ